MDPGALLASLGDAGARDRLRAAWGPHLRACLKAAPERAGAHLAAVTAHWEQFPHQADMGVRGFGATEDAAFEQAAATAASGTKR